MPLFQQLLTMCERNASVIQIGIVLCRCGLHVNCAYTSVSNPLLMLPQAAHEAFEGSKAAAGSAWHSDAAHKATNKAKVSRWRPLSRATPA